MLAFRWFGVAILLLSFFVVSARAQLIPGEGPAISANPVPGQTQPEQTEQDAKLQQNLAILRQKKRFEEVKRDSQKLLELATELNQYVDKSGENILSLDVMRKADEMEKLARQVKNNMRGQ